MLLELSSHAFGSNSTGIAQCNFGHHDFFLVGFKHTTKCKLYMDVVYQSSLLCFLESKKKKEKLKDIELLS